MTYGHLAAALKPYPMNRLHAHALPLLLCLLLFPMGIPAAEPVNIAVASNFMQTARVLAERFEAQSGSKLILSFGSTGKQYAQIMHGAPFAVFLAADARRPALLERDGIALPGSRFTYALGRIVLWSPDPSLIDPLGRVLESDRYRHLAIANPKLAPYGKAAQEVLQARGLWPILRQRLVRGENIGQAFQFVKSGSVDLGFVAYAQVKRPGEKPEGSLWEVPKDNYTAIEQQAVLLKEDPVARAFLDYLKSEQAIALIRDYGYGTP